MITFGSPDSKIKEASEEELLHAIITPDGCACKKKLLILKEILCRKEKIEELLNKDNKYK